MQRPSPEIDDINSPYWDALAKGRLIFQVCSCGNNWLPARALCPNCLKKDWEWKTASGKGHIYSWVVYHTAFHEAFKDRLPYNVAIIELEEGPRLISNVLADNERLHAGAPVRLVVTKESDIALTRFELAA